MRTDSAAFAQKNALLAKELRFVFEMSFDAPTYSVLRYFTSHADAALPGGAVAVTGVLVKPSVTSQTLNPDTANSTIGSMSFELVDKDSAVTALLAGQLAAGHSTRKQRVRAYVGFAGDAWADYSLVQTQLVSALSFTKGGYRFSCQDLQREVRKDIFDTPKTNLAQTLGADRLSAATIGGDGSISLVDATDFPTSGSGVIRDPGSDNDFFTWSGKSGNTLTGCSGVLAHPKDSTVADATVVVYDATDFQMIAHGTSFSDSPSATVGYVQIEKEVIRYTGKTSTTFTGCLRGALNTFAVKHEADPGTAQDQRPEIRDYPYLEMPAPKLIYALLTGVLHNQGGATLPDSYHLGIPTALVRLSDFTDAAKRDLWDPSDDQQGVMAFVQGMEKTDGKKFIEEQLALLCGCFPKIYADGALGFQRMARVLAGAAYLEMLDESNVTGWSSLDHDYNSVHNLFIIRWNWEPSKGDYTRVDAYEDLGSLAIYKDAPVFTLKLRAEHGSRSTRATLAKRFDSIRDRYTGPPLRMQLNGLHRLNNLEVGDVVRVRLGNVRDHTKPNGGGPIDRAFEIQNISVDWQGGVSLALFGSSLQPGSIPATGDAGVLADSFYTSAGTQVVNGTGGLTVSGSNPIHISGTGTLSGNADMTNAGAVFYLNDDVQIDAGANVTLVQNVQLRVKGFLQVNGIINGKGGGPAGAAYPSAGTAAGVGTTEAGGSIILPSRTLSGIRMTPGYERGQQVVGLNQNLPYFTLDVQSGGTVLKGLPSDLRGTSGSSGSPFILTQPNPVSVPGGAGGAGGAGFLVICRGMNIGASGQVNLGGNDGALGTATQALGAGDFIYAGSGAGGAPGGFLVLLDGSGSSSTGVTEGSFIALQGKTTIPGKPLDVFYDEGSLGSVYTSFVGTGDGTSFPLPDLSGPRGGYSSQNVPGSPTPQADSAASLATIYGFDIVESTVTSLQIATQTVTGGAAGNLALTTVTGANIANLTITAAQIANATITGTQIASATITGGNIASATITGANIQDATIQGIDIASATIAGSNIGSATVTGTNIASATITGANIASGTITGGNISSGTITGGNIDSLTITAGNIANLTITAGQIATATITGAQIANSTITNANIVASTITGGSIAAGTITAGNMVAGTITAASGIIADINADTITSGSIRGINVNASSHTTKGSYLSSATGVGDGTVNVKNTADFAASGSAHVIDTTNDRDTFTYTGKTATTLTGCSGVLAHNNGATIIPLVPCVVIDAGSHEVRWYGDRGDGVIEELASIGVGNLDPSIATFGSSTSKKVPLAAHVDGSTNNFGAFIASTQGGTGPAIQAQTGGSGPSVKAGASTSTGYGGQFHGNSTRGNLRLVDVGVFPSTKGAEDVVHKGGRLYYADGSHWYPLTMPYFESSEQTITSSSNTTVAHGLTDGAGNNRRPSNLRGVIRCITAEAGFAAGDEIPLETFNYDGTANHGIQIYANATNVGFIVSPGNPIVLDISGPGTPTSLTPANWKVVLRAS